MSEESLLSIIRDIAPDTLPTMAVEKGTVIMHPGEVKSDIYFVVSGHVRLQTLSEEGRCVYYRDILEGDYFGWLSAMYDQPRQIEAEACHKSQLICISKNKFMEILSTSPRAMNIFHKRLALVVRTYTDRIHDLYTESAKSRLIKEIVRLKSQSKPGQAIKFPKHEQLASQIVTSRETVTRLLKQLEAEGLILKAEDGYRIQENLKLENKLIEL